MNFSSTRMGCISLLRRIRSVAPQCIQYFDTAENLAELLPRQPSVIIVDGMVLYRKLAADMLFGNEVFFSVVDPNGPVAEKVARAMGDYLKRWLRNAFAGIAVKIVFDGVNREIPKERGPTVAERATLCGDGLFHICFSTQFGSTSLGRRQVNKGFWPCQDFFKSVSKKLEAIGNAEWNRPVWCRVAVGEADFVISAIARLFPDAIVLSSDSDYLVFSEVMAMVRPHAE